MINNTNEDNTKIKDISSVTVSASVLGDIVGISDRRVRQIGEEGIFIRATKGRYKLLESIKNYIINLKVEADNKKCVIDNELNYEEERALLTRVNRHLAELKLSLAKGEAHKAGDVKAVMSDMLVSFRSRLLNIPSKVSPKLVNKSNADYVKNILVTEINEVLQELSDYSPDKFSENCFSEDNEESEYIDDENDEY